MIRIVNGRKALFPYVLVACGLFVLALIGFSSQQVQAANESATDGEHLLTVHDRGVERVFLTGADTVGEALKRAKIELSQDDTVEPGLDEKLIASNYSVNIYRARPVIVVDGFVRQKVMTASQTPEQIAETAGLKLHDEDEATLDLSTNLIGDGMGLELLIDRAIPLTLVLYGQSVEMRTQSSTVAELLKEKDIKLEKSDKLSVDLAAPVTAGMRIELWRDGKQTITVDEDVNFETEKIQDADREVGFREVKTPGEKGKRTVTYEIEMRNGEEIARTEIQSVTTKEPKKQIEIVGIKNNYSGSLNEWLLALRTCETGNNYARNSGNGYYGAYQFLPSTWNSIAKRSGRNDLVGVMPHQASPADQDAMVIANTNATAGLSTQHPGCYKKLGLSNKPPM